MRYYFKIILVFFLLTLQGCEDIFFVPVVSPEKATLDVNLNGVWEKVSGICDYISLIPLDRKAHLLKCFDEEKLILLFKVSCTLINGQKYCSFRFLKEELLMEYTDFFKDAPENEVDAWLLNKAKQEGMVHGHFIVKITKMRDTLLVQGLEANENEAKKIRTTQALHRFIISNQDKFSEPFIYKKLGKDQLPKDLLK